MGIKLKSPSEILQLAPINNKLPHDAPWRQAHSLANTRRKASKKFINGPARLQHRSPKLRCLKFSGQTSTGRAQPSTWKELKAQSNGITTDPKKEICAKGFKVKRPWILGVSSPKHKATQARAHSWNVNEINTHRQLITINWKCDDAILGKRVTPELSELRRLDKWIYR